MSAPYVQHTHIQTFADEKVNLKRELVKKYREQVNNLKEELESYINDNPDYDLVKMLNSGSVAKGTALKTLDDIDVAVYLKQAVDVKEEDLLNWLIDRLKEVYSQLKPDQFECPPGSHCVSIRFKESGLKVDVVPVIYEDNPDDYGYLTTKDTGERVLTSISLHLEFIRKRKEAQPNHFVQIVRLLKWWVRQQKVKDSLFGFKSFMVELICAHLADDGLDMSDYPNALRKIFGFICQSGLTERISFDDYYDKSILSSSTGDAIEIFDPVNPVNNIASKYSEADRLRIIEAAKDSLEALAEAHFATTQSRAVEMYKIVFGQSFRIIT